MRVLITGGRDFNNARLIKMAFIAIGCNIKDTLVDGGCKGCDQAGELVAKQIGMHIERHTADWNSFGRAAGPIRNKGMVDSGVNICVSFPGGRGTKNCTNLAKAANVPTIEIKVSDSKEDIAKKYRIAMNNVI